MSEIVRGSTRPTPPQVSTATVIMVHGAWHGAWAFDKVLPLLAASDVPALAVDLPGHGNSKESFTDLHGDARLVSQILDGIDGNVVLVGHSYGGAVITEAGVHDAVTRLVYLCANVPDPDEETAASGDLAVTMARGARPAFADAVLSHPDGTLTLDPEIAAACLYNDCDDETVAWALARLGSHPSLNLLQQPTTVAWRSTPSTYVLCRNDQTVHPRIQRQMANRCTFVVEWDTGHSPFASQPQLVADLLASLARAG